MSILPWLTDCERIWRNSVNYASRLDNLRYEFALRVNDWLGTPEFKPLTGDHIDAAFAFWVAGQWESAVETALGGQDPERVQYVLSELHRRIAAERDLMKNIIHGLVTRPVQ